MKTKSTIASCLPLLAVIGLLVIPRTSLAASISCGQTVTGVTTSPSEADAYAFSGSAGQVISVSLWAGINPTFDPMVADIYNPSGQLVATATAGNSGYSGISGGAVDLTLTNSGSYTIVVHDLNNAYTASYALSLQTVNEGGCSAQSIACGQTLANATTNDSEMTAYTFSGSTGQVISVSLWAGINPTFDPMVADIYNPSGQLVATTTAGNSGYSGISGGAVNLTLTNSGSYTVLVHDSGYVFTANYALSLQTVNEGGCSAQSIACGQTLANATTNDSEMTAYTFSGSTGQVISVSLWAGINPTFDPMVADIYNPSGQLVATTTAGNSGYSGISGGAVNLTLTNSGSYTVLVHDSGYVFTANYALSLQTVNEGGCSAQSIACGQTLANATTNDSEMTAYTFSGSTGQVISVSLWAGINPTFDPMVADIYNPSGQLVATATAGNHNIQNNSGGAVNLILTNSGNYTVLVHDSGYVFAASYALSLQTVNNGGCNSPTLACGNTLNGQISIQSQMNSYELVATASEHVLLSDSGFSGMTVDIYDPTGSNIVSIASSTSTNYTFAITGIYTVLVHSGNYIGTGSYGISLTVFGGCDDLPTVSVAPTNLVLYPGGSATFTANASGPSPLYYQWRFDNSQIMGATNTYYGIASVQTNNSGSYVVVVSNPGGSVTSAPPAILSLGALQLGLKFSGTGLMLTWPTNFTGFTLQAATNLTPPIVWSNVVVTPTTANGQNVVSNSISGPQRFFRLTQ